MINFYSIGVGSGEGGYITIGAIRAIEKSDIIAMPVKKYGEKSTALEILKKEYDTSKKEIMEVEFLMSPDIKLREQSRKKSAEKIIDALKNGKTVSMITLGDVSVYSTCSYIHNAVKKNGFKMEIIPGITSFCAAANKIQTSLCEGNESFAVIPSVNITLIEKYITDFDTLIVMKAGLNIDKLYDVLLKHGLENNAIVTSSLGLSDEVIEKIDKDKKYGYFTTVIIKRKGF